MSRVSLVSSNIGPSLIGSQQVLPNTWNHYALTRSGNVITGFLNGVQDFQYVTSNTLDGSSGAQILSIGGAPSSNGGLVGNIDELRVSNVARYCSVSLQTAPFPSPVLYEYPPVSLSTTASGTNPSSSLLSNLVYGNGIYTANASSNSVGMPAYMAFDKTSNEWFVSSTTNWASNGIYQGSGSQLISGTTFSGDWISLQLPYPISLQSYLVTPGSHGFSSWVLAGSNDANTWTLVDTQYNVPVTPRFALDGLSANALTNANGLFSCYRLLTSWTGPVVNIRRGSDSATLDFFADNQGNLWNSNVSLVNWVGSSNAYVTTWYDQSGKGHHATQPTASIQPQYNATLKLIDFTSPSTSSNVYMFLPSTTFPTITTQSTVSVKLGKITAGSGVIALSGGNGTNGSQYGITLVTSQYYWNQVGGAVTAGTAASGDITTWKMGGTSGTQVAYQNANPFLTTSAAINSGSAVPAYPDAIGGSNGSVLNTPLGSGPLNGQLYFLSIFYTWLSAADTQVVEAQNYVPSQVAPIPVSVPPSPPYSSYLLMGTKGALGATSNTFVGVPQLSAGTSNVYSWPQSNLAVGVTSTGGNQYTTTLSGQAYGNGNYVMNASSIFNTNALPPYYAFDKTSATEWAATTTTYSASTPYGYSAGTYSTTIQGISSPVGGEWLQIQFPSTIVITSYTLTARNDGFFNQTPAVWYIVGSNDGSTWYSLDYRSLTYTSAGQSQTFPVSTTVAYSWYRIVITNTSGSTNASIGELVFSSVQNYAPILQTGVVTGTTYAFPLSTLSAAPTYVGSNVWSSLVTGQTSGNGTYITNCSSNAAGYYAYQAFSPSLASQWASTTSPVGYNTSVPASYIGPFVTYDTLGNSYPGEWVQVQLPTPVTTTSYVVGPGQGSGYTYQSPVKWYILGSMDGVNWRLMDTRTYTWSSTANQTFTFTTPGQYSTFRMVMNQLQNGTSYGPVAVICNFQINTTSVFTANTGGISELRLLSNTLVYEYPPASLVTGVSGTNPSTTVLSNLAYGNGTYICNASSYYSSLTLPCNPFSKSGPGTPTYWTAGNNYYYGANTTYSGPTTALFTTNVGSTNYYGEWVSLTLPGPIILSSYSVTTSQINQSGSQAIVSWVLVGSNDGTTWYLVDSKSGVIWSTTLTVQSYTVSASNAYSIYRIVPLQSYNSVTVSFTQLRLFTTQPLYEYPPSSLATGVSGTQPSTTVVTGQAYGNGTYVANASSYFGTLYAYQAFDKTAQSSGGANGWASTTGVYNTTSGVYTGSKSLGGVSGEWLSIQFPSSVSVTSYSITGQYNFNDWMLQAPASFTVLGSTNGTTWVTLDTRSGLTWTTSGQVQTFYISSPSFYSYYAMVVTTVGLNCYDACTAIAEWRLFSSVPLIGPPLALTPAYPLDSLSSTALSSANGLFSTKRLLSKYQGPVVNLRRSSDSATLDFFADALGNLFNGRQTVQGWLAGATAYVTTWYDQSGQGNHATQATTSLQPTYNSNTKAIVLNSTYFQLPSLPSGNSPYTYTIKVSNVAFVSSYSIYVTGGNYVANQNIELFSNPTNVIHSWVSSDMTTATTATTNQFFTFSYDQTNRYTFLNGSLQTTLASSSHAQVNSNNYIGYDPRGYYSASSLTSISILSSNVSTSDRLIVEAQP